MPQIIKQLPDRPQLELLNTKAEQVTKAQKICALSVAEQFVAGSYGFSS